MQNFKQRFELNEFPDSKSGNFSLTISGVNVSDAGIYTCAQEEGAGPRHSSRLKVQQAHTFSDVKASVGSVVHLPCLTAVETWVHWVLQDNETSTETIISSEGNVERQFRDRFELNAFDRGDYTLTINNVGLTDSGLYTCIEMENNIDSKHTVRLSVSAPETDACSSHPCRNCGICARSSTGNNYTCECAAGFTGKNCEQDVEECRSSPCRNDGVCVEGVNKFTCVCAAGFTGTVCDQRVGTTQPASHSTPVPNAKSWDNNTTIIVVLATLLSFCVAALACLPMYMFRKRCVKACRRLQLHGHESDPLLKDNQVINKYVCVTGVTILENKLCMLRGHLIQVYETETYQLIQGRSFPELFRHYRNDITSCETNKCLYISDYLRKYIHTLKLPLVSEMPVQGGVQEADGTQTHQLKALCSLKYGPSGLSVTANHEILVTCVNDHKLLLVSPDGERQREIQLDSDIESPLHAVQNPLEPKQFFVCHSGDGIWLVEVTGIDPTEAVPLPTGAAFLEPTGSATLMPEHSVETAQDSASGSDGHKSHNVEVKVAVTVQTGHCSTIKSYGGQTKLRNHRRLGWPCHVAVTQEGCVYVADKYNDRVVLLDKDLKFVKVVKDLERPRRLCLHEDGQKLYVGQKNGEVVKIFIHKGGRSTKVVEKQLDDGNNNKGVQGAMPRSEGSV